MGIMMNFNPIFPFENMVAAIALVAAASGLLAWRGARKARRWPRVLVTAARTAGVLLLAAVALNPGNWVERRSGRETEWVILADRSLSMAVKDADGRSRWSEAVRLAAKAASFDPERARIDVFSDAAAQSSLRDLETTVPDGKGTDIPSAIDSALNRARATGRNLAGVLLLSDGRQTIPAREGIAIKARAQDSPVYAVPIGGHVPVKDLAVRSGRRQYVGFAGQKTRIHVTVDNKGLGPVKPTVRLLDSAGKVLDSRQVEAPDNGSVPVQFEIEAGKAGWSEYRVVTDPWEGERILGNNESGFGVMTLENRLRVFVAEGTPHWDSKFLVQLLRKQANVEVTSVYRVTSERYFKVETDVSKSSESSESIFPDSPGELGAYDLVIFGKGVEYFLTPARIALLKDFVREQGGCVMFARGKPYSGSFPELDSMEPASAWGDQVAGRIRFRPTVAGEEAGLFGESMAGRDDPVWGRMPPIDSAHRCIGLKPFVEILAEGVVDTGQGDAVFPLLMSRRYGRGLVLVMNAEGIWHWDFFPQVAEAGNVYQELWPSLLQWAAMHSEFLPGAEYSLRLAESVVQPGRPVRVAVSRRTAAAAGAASPALGIWRGGTLVGEQPTAAMETAGRWDAMIAQSEPGMYKIELLDSPGGKSLGVSAVLQVAPPPAEEDELSSDPAFLRALAEQSGGQVVAEADLEKTVGAFAAVQQRDVRTEKAVWTPSWAKWWWLCAALACFTVEWFVRRRSGLM